MCLYMAKIQRFGVFGGSILPLRLCPGLWFPPRTEDAPRRPIEPPPLASSFRKFGLLLSNALRARSQERNGSAKLIGALFQQRYFSRGIRTFKYFVNRPRDLRRCLTIHESREILSNAVSNCVANALSRRTNFTKIFVDFAKKKIAVKK